jgi:hypothetical protein
VRSVALSVLSVIPDPERLGPDARVCYTSEQGFRWELTLLGLAVMAGLYTYAYFLLRFKMASATCS